MQNFIVLGFIPGTQIQITFQLWLQIVAMLLTLLVGLYVLRHHKRLSVLILSLYVRRIMSERQLASFPAQLA